MKILVLAAAALAMSTSVVLAFPESFGLPHYVTVDQWPGDQSIDRMATGSIEKPCSQKQIAEKHCPRPESETIRK